MPSDPERHLRLVPTPGASPEVSGAPNGPTTATGTATAPGSASGLGEQPDDLLALLARGGDRAAFTSLVRRHQHKVIAFGTRFFGQQAVALDVAQEVFLDLLRALPRYQPRGRFHVYLYRITFNRCRMTARRVRYEDRVRDRVFADASDLPLAPDEVATRDRQRRLSRAMRALPEKHRAVVQLRFWGGLSHEEIAEALDTKEGTVKSRLFHALGMLRAELGPSGELP